jgi:hypothetical protein
LLDGASRVLFIDFLLRDVIPLGCSGAPPPSGFSMARASRIGLRAANLCKWQNWARAFLAAIFLLPAIEAWPAKQMARDSVAMACVGQSCGRSPAITNIPNEDGSLVQMAANYQPPLGYFLDELPADFDLSKAPSGAKEVSIARVRALEIPNWLGGRDQSGVSPTNLPRDKFFIRMRVLEVRSGSATVGKVYDIYFGEWGRDLLYPLTPDQLARDYIVAMYLDPLDAKHRLIGFPVSSTQYSDWMTKRSEYWRSKYKK